MHAGIIPMITLHHFAHPQWFEEMGAFEKEENIAVLCAICANSLSVDSAQSSCSGALSMNQALYVLQGYLRRCFSSRKGQYCYWTTTRHKSIAETMMQAHTETYRALKAMPGGASRSNWSRAPIPQV